MLDLFMQGVLIAGFSAVLLYLFGFIVMFGIYLYKQIKV
jgi:hypothetical protein